MQRTHLIVALSVLCLFSLPAWGWNDVGHMTIARIAYERLTDGERIAVMDILRHHPHLHELLLKDRPKNVSQSEWIFLQAAVWPDKIRPPHDHARAPIHVHPLYRYHHPSWHYANFEYRSGQGSSALPAHPLPPQQLHGRQTDPTNIVEQLDYSYLIVRGREREFSEPETELSPAESRAIRMCWLMHLMGDIHQPLHIATLVNPLVPALQHGDEGGNKLAVRVNQHSAPRKLHAVWDDLLGTNARYDKIVQLSERLSHDPRLASSRLPEFAHRRLARDFAEESYQAAKDLIYQNGRLNFALWSSVESNQVSMEFLPAISQSIMDQSHAFAERRVVLAGYRLAERLKYIVQHDDYAPESLGQRETLYRRVTPTRHVTR